MKRGGKPLIVLDPGHGGIDNGATGVGGTLEKAIVLNFANLLKEKLEKSGLYDVHLTREDDTFISLSRRVEIGHELEADLFISIHADFGAARSKIRAGSDGLHAVGQGIGPAFRRIGGS